MLIKKAYKTQIYPTRSQEKTLQYWLDISRAFYNRALDMRKGEYEAYKKAKDEGNPELPRVNGWYGQSKLFTQARKQGYWGSNSIPRMLMELTLQDLDLAYDNFFRGLKKKQEIGFPKPRKYHPSFRINKVSPSYIKNNTIKIPKLGLIRLSENNYLPTNALKIFFITLSKRANRWFVSVQVEEEVEEHKPEAQPLGIDLGTKEDSHVTVSDGRKFSNPKALYRLSRKLRKLNKKLSRQKLGSSHWEKTKIQLQKLHYRISNIRNYHAHQVTSEIIGVHGDDRDKPRSITVEDLNVSGMMRGHNARSVGDAGMGEIRRQLEYKSAWNNIQFVKADTFFPSSQLCSVCGSRHKEMKNLNKRTFECECGLRIDRDVNAAINLKQYVAPMSEETKNARREKGGKPFVEARTTVLNTADTGTLVETTCV